MLTRDVDHNESRIFGVDRRKVDVVATSIRLLAMVPVIGETPIRCITDYRVIRVERCERHLDLSEHQVLRSIFSGSRSR